MCVPITCYVSELKVDVEGKVFDSLLSGSYQLSISVKVRLFQECSGNCWPFASAALFASDLSSCLSDVVTKYKLIQLQIYAFAYL